MNKDYIQKTLTIVSFVLPTILFGICLFSTFFLADNIAAHFDSNNNVNRPAIASKINFKKNTPIARATDIEILKYTQRFSFKISR